MSAFGEELERITSAQAAVEAPATTVEAEPAAEDPPAPQLDSVAPDIPGPVAPPLAPEPPTVDGDIHVQSLAPRGASRDRRRGRGGRGPLVAAALLLLVSGLGFLIPGRSTPPAPSPPAAQAHPPAKARASASGQSARAPRRRASSSRRRPARPRRTLRRAVRPSPVDSRSVPASTPRRVAVPPAPVYAPAASATSAHFTDEFTP